MARVYVSCGFREGEKRWGDWGAELLADDHEPIWFGGVSGSSKAVLEQAKEEIPDCSGLLAFVHSRDGHMPPGVRDELTLAVNEDLPVLAIWSQDKVEVGGILGQAPMKRVEMPEDPMDALADTITGWANELPAAGPDRLPFVLEEDDGLVRPPDVVAQRFRVPNETTSELNIHHVGVVVCGTQVDGPALAHNQGPSEPFDTTGVREGSKIPAVIARQLGVADPRVATYQPDAVQPLDDLDLLAGFEGHNPHRRRIPRVGIWVVANDHLPVLRAYAFSYSQYSPHPRELDGPPYDFSASIEHLFRDGDG